MADILKHSEYRDWLRELKQQIKTGQIKATLSVNSQMILLYWDLGRQIAKKQETAQWGSGFIEQLSKDLRDEFPEMSGLSVTNLNYCKRFFKFYSPPEGENPLLSQSTLNLRVNYKLLIPKKFQFTPKLGVNWKQQK